VNIGGTTIRFQSGFYLAAAELWAEINDTVLNYPGPVIFTGHSRGGCIAQNLHVFASNTKPERKQFHYSIPCSSTPVVNTFGQALEANSYAFVVDQDPISRLTFANMKEWIEGLRAKQPPQSPTEYFAEMSSQVQNFFIPMVLTFFINDAVWNPVEEWMKQPANFQITKVFGRIYWLQHWMQGIWTFPYWFQPTKYLHEHRVEYVDIGQTIDWRGIGDHLPGFHRLEDLIDRLPCKPGVTPAPTGNKPAKRCNDPDNWFCAFGYVPEDPRLGKCGDWWEEEMCLEDVEWKGTDEVFECEPTPVPAPDAEDSTFGKVGLVFLILFAVVLVAAIAIIAFLLLRRAPGVEVQP
jgi:hypothetical protein